MLERALDPPWDIGSNDKHDGGPHQRDGDVTRPDRRIPNIDPARRPIAGKPDADQNQPGERHEREQTFVRSLSQSRDQGRAVIAQTYEGMPAEKQPQTEDEYR